ncbi:efflux RND transporter periplasmic adaptor subunit [Bacillaceae bacterium]
MRNWAGKTLIVLLFGTAVLAGGCSPAEPAAQSESGEEAIPVFVQNVELGTVEAVAGFTGKLEAEESVAVSPKISGKIGEIRVTLGQKVKEGDVLFTLDDQDLQNALRQAEAAYEMALANLQQSEESSAQAIEQAKHGVEQQKLAVTQAENGVAQAKRALEDAKRNEERTRQLYEAGGVPLAELERAQTALKNAEIAFANAQTTLQNARSAYAYALQTLEHANKKVAVNVAQASLNQAEVNVQNAREQLDNVTVTAPISGMIAAVDGSTGQIVGPQTPVVTIVDTDPIVVKAMFSEKEIAKIKTGMKVLVEIPAIGKEVEAKINRVSPSLDPQLKAYPAEIAVPNPDGTLKPGMVVNVKVLHSAAEAKYPVIPREAVVEEEGKTFVYRIEGDRAQKTEIVIGQRTSEQVEVKKGISPGDTIVVKGQSLLKDGAKVKLVGDGEDEEKDGKSDQEISGQKGKP